MRSRRGELQRFFTFGGRVPASVGLVLALMLVASVWGWMERGLQALAALSPVQILLGEMMIYWLGQQLAYVWSERRFILRFFGYALFASVATTLAALIWAPAS